jgi:hypothetical protein
MVLAAHRQTSARELISMTAPSQQDTPSTNCSDGRLFLYRFRVRLFRFCCGWSSYVGKDHVGVWMAWLWWVKGGGLAELVVAEEAIDAGEESGAEDLLRLRAILKMVEWCTAVCACVKFVRLTR